MLTTQRASHSPERPGQAGEEERRSQDARARPQKGSSPRTARAEQLTRDFTKQDARWPRQQCWSPEIKATAAPYSCCSSVTKSCLTLRPHQLQLSSTISQSLLKFTSIELVRPSNISPSVATSPPAFFPSIRVFSNELALCLRLVAQVLELQLQHQSLQRMFRVDFL